MQYKRGGLRNAEKEFYTSRCHGPAPQQARRGRSGHMADTWPPGNGGHTQTRLGGAAKVDTRRTRGGCKAVTWLTCNIADKVWWRGQSGRKADTRRARGRHKAGTWRTHGGQVQMAGKVWGQSGLKDHMADARWTHGGHMRTRFGGAAKAESKRTQGGQWRTRFGGAAKERSRRTQGGHLADIWRTQGGHVADKVWRYGADTWRTQGGHRADTRRTHRGQAPGTRPGHIAASLLFSEREPHSKLFGEKSILSFIDVDLKLSRQGLGMTCGQKIKDAENLIRFGNPHHGKI